MSENKIDDFTEAKEYFDNLTVSQFIHLFVPYLQKEIEIHYKEYPEIAIEESKLICIYFDLIENPNKYAAEIVKKSWNNMLADFNAKHQLTIVQDIIEHISPNSHVMPNNSLMNILCNPEKKPINAGAFDLVVANPKGKRKEITVYAMIDYEEEYGIPTKLTEYERQVSNAIVSLWLDAVNEGTTPIFTTDMIFRAMPGCGDKPSPQQKGAITKAIEKFRRLHIYVDATDELRKRKIIGKNETRIFDDFYLSATRCSGKIKNGGQTVNAYRINAEPIILTYCRLTSQILTVPAKYIAIKKVKDRAITHEALAMTSDRQAMTGYMVRRIAIMKRDKQQSRTILFNTLFEDVGITDQSRDRAMDNRNFCCQVLDYQIAVGNIKDYEKQTKGRSIIGVQIKI